MVLAALAVVVHARYITDLSAFLPARPTPLQKILVDQLRDGPASRLIVIALENGDVHARASVSAELAKRLRTTGEFSTVENGEPRTAERDREFLFQHRYLLSDAITPQRFSSAGLRAAIDDTLLNLATSSGLLLKSWVSHDPTGEMLRIIDQLTRTQSPKTQDGVWVSTDATRTLLVAQTLAAGSDTDAQERAQDAIRGAFAALVPGSAAAAIHLRLSGPGVFAVAARAKIKNTVTRLSIISSILVVAVLLTVYRSVTALVLGLLPVASGALVGIAAVALGFGAVHGITLGFGITLIGESVDYSIYFFIQSWQRRLWPTIRLGMLLSVCGFASLLPSGFPGLAQLGLYSISGLIAAALVTRFLLPELLPRSFSLRDVSPLGEQLARWRDSVRRVGGSAIPGVACILAIAALIILFSHRGELWNRELSALSPVPLQDQQYDATLRADLGAADVLDTVIVSAPSLEAVLVGAERASGVLESLIDTKVIGDFESPTNYLPSLAQQRRRRDALPRKSVLESNLRQAIAGSNLNDQQLAAFVADVDAARQAALVTPADLRGTSLSAAFGALVFHESDGWVALMSLHAPPGNTATPNLDVGRVSAALAQAHLLNTQVLDLKVQTDALYAAYLREAIRLSSAGFALIVLLLLVTLRSLARVARVIAPLLLAVLTVCATLAVFGQQLTILHLVGMLLIVAVGSNYALFFDQEGRDAPQATSSLTLASLGIANLSTVIGFGLLSFSQVPVLVALGATVAPGTLLALLFSALMTAPPLQAIYRHA